MADQRPERTPGWREVLIVAGPGYGLNEAARDALKKFRFSPATQKGEPVRYQFVYTYTFLLD